MAKRLQYSENDMEKALEAVKNGIPVFRASKMFNVPRTTLLYKHTGKYPVERKIGPETVLSKHEEALLVDWIFKSVDAGFPVTKNQLLDSVQISVKQLKRSNNFTDSRPGRHWYESFLKRHSELAQRVSQNLSKARSSVTEENLRQWFSEIQNYFQEKAIPQKKDEEKEMLIKDKEERKRKRQEKKILKVT